MKNIYRFLVLDDGTVIKGTLLEINQLLTDLPSTQGRIYLTPSQFVIFQNNIKDFHIFDYEELELEYV